jgi:multiple sugar transport system permease protein
MLLNHKVIGISFFRTMLYLPSVAPSVAVAMLWLWLFNPDFGLLNYLLGAVGLPKLLWIHDETQVIPSFVLMSIWRLGGPMIIFLAGLQGIPPSLYEAAELDGGGWWRKLWYVTLPLMTPSFFFNAVMGIISSFQIFNEAYIMTDGGPNNGSLFQVYYIYLNAFRYGKMGYASSLAWALFVIILIVTLVMFRASRNWVHYETKGR